MTVRTTAGRHAGIPEGPAGCRRDTGADRTPEAGPIHRPSPVLNSEIRTIARRLQHASATMGVDITRAFAERMAIEGLRRSGEVGIVQATDTVIIFAESSDRAGVSILGWADEHACLDRFASPRLAPSPPATAPLDPGPADSTGPEL